MKTKRPWWDRLNSAIFPFMGPAQLGPVEAPVRPDTGPARCPICGQLMSLHEIERGEGRIATRMFCP